MADAAEAARSYGAVLCGDGLSRPDKLLHLIYLIYIQRTEIDDTHSFALLLFSVSIAYPSSSCHRKQLFIGIFSKITELQLTYPPKSSIIFYMFLQEREGTFLSRLSIETPGKAETVIAGLYRDIERRISASPPGLCPVDMSLSFLRLCHAQTCGKCVPCRIGLGQLTTLLEQVLDSTATPETIDLIEKTARVIQDTADCAIGYEAARMVLQGVQGFRDDYLSHVESGRCLFGWDHPVPCVALCPAGVDIPGYIALVRAGRYNDAVRLIRKDNPFPTVCGYVCEHPCEAHCRRSMVDDAVNICGIKRFACDHADNTTPPDSAPSTGKRIGIIGGGPGGLSAAYFLSLMGHQVVVYDQRPNLGGMLRYGIPDYRLPQDKLDADIDFILSTGIEVHTGVSIGRDISFAEIENQYDAVYISIGAHND